MLQLSSTLRGGLQRSLVTPRAQYINVCDYSFGFHGIRYKPGLTQDLTTFSTHRGNFKWLCASMGAASSPALYVEAMTNVLNEYGICAGSRSTGKHQMTEKGKLMHEIFSTAAARRASSSRAAALPTAVSYIATFR